MRARRAGRSVARAVKVHVTLCWWDRSAALGYRTTNRVRSREKAVGHGARQGHVGYNLAHIPFNTQSPAGNTLSPARGSPAPAAAQPTAAVTGQRWARQECFLVLFSLSFNQVVKNLAGGNQTVFSSCGGIKFYYC